MSSGSSDLSNVTKVFRSRSISLDIYKITDLGSWKKAIIFKTLALCELEKQWLLLWNKSSDWTSKCKTNCDRKKSDEFTFLNIQNNSKVTIQKSTNQFRNRRWPIRCLPHVRNVRRSKSATVDYPADRRKLVSEVVTSHGQLRYCDSL